MKSLPALPRLLEEEHRLQRQYVGSDQGLQHIDDARMQQEALGNFAAAMGHVDAVVEAAAFSLGRVIRWRWQAGHGAPPRHHIISEIGPFPRFFRRDQAADDQITIAAESSVFFHPHFVGLVYSCGRLCQNHAADLRTRFQL